MFSAYFFFHYLNMFCVEKQVSEFFATHLVTRKNFSDSFCDSSVVQHKSWVHPEAFATHLTTHENFCNSLNREMPKNNFLKGFSWKTCFKPLSSSLKPLFHYFFIKTQLIWMVFHSINISKVIINSFNWFWSLDYILESFVLLVGIFIIGVGKTSFLSKKFSWDWFLLLICFGRWALMTTRSCIKGEFHVVHALFYIVVHSVHARCLIKCLLGIFSLVWTPMSTKFCCFSCFLIKNIFGSLVVYLTHLAPHVHFPCIDHALHIATSCTHLCYPCHALVYALFLHPSMSYLAYAL